MKTFKLTGKALNWAVSKAEEIAWLADPSNTPQPSPDSSYSTDWALAGPIIEREGIALALLYGSTWGATTYPISTIGKDHSDSFYQGVGNTPLLAAMRCYVYSRFGDRVSLPEELT